MDRNNMRASYLSTGPRSLPHLGGGGGGGGGGKRHSNGHAHARLSPPAPAPAPAHAHAPAPPHAGPAQQHDDIINYIYDSWNKVTRDVERGGEEARYYSEAAAAAPRALANFRPFNLDEWWGRRLLQALHRPKHRS